MGITDTFLSKDTRNKLLSSPWRSEDTYVTAGAYMACTLGSHEEVLNKQEPNGIFINGSPMLTVDDCVPSTSTSGTIRGVIPFQQMGQEVDGNFYSFGFCRSERHPMKLAESIAGRDSSYVFDTDSTEPTFGQEIYPCAPQIMPTVSAPSPIQAAAQPSALPALPTLSSLLDAWNVAKPQWTNGSPTVSIQGVPALTSKSCLFCTCGGQIRLLTNGMDPAPPEFSAR
ncbi:PAAR-like protein [Paenibacillus sp. NPDC058174]|uniref:PAAR-like protein n=1 Tax=Paenibacillus sp. NPDC058174 TaxID=3346366 RepID=UPI0036DC9FA7